jgi:hypothetical protein
MSNALLGTFFKRPDHLAVRVQVRSGVHGPLRVDTGRSSDGG